MATNQQIQNASDALATNPMFHMSLASKELFHSNFLYWLWISDAKAFLKLLDNLSDCEDFSKMDPKQIEVKREYQHFDLCVVEKGNPHNVLLLIENKVKSIPYIEQLEQYTAQLNDFSEKSYNKLSRKVKAQTSYDKNKQYKKVLLTLMQNIPDEEKIKQDGWSIKNYEHLVTSIKSYSKHTTNINEDEKLFIKYYQEFIEQLNSLVQGWSDTFKIGNSVLLNENLYKVANELRLHDLYGKLYYSWIACELNTRLKNAQLLGGWGKNNDKSISAKAEYTKVQPMITIAIPEVYKGAEFCIQIQGNHYRHAIARPNETFESVKGEFENKKDVCDFWWTKKYTKKFTHFGGFIYKYWKLKEEVAKNQFTEQTVNDLIVYIIKDLKKLKQKKNDWQNI